MLDSKSKLVLKYICGECSDGTYKIIDAADIISALPQRLKIDHDALEQILNQLEENDLITIKYSDETVYCMSVLQKGRQIFEENEKQGKKNPKASKTKIPFYSYIILFFCALLGGFIGSLIIKFLF